MQVSDLKAIGERLQRVIDHTAGGNQRAFADKTGVTPSMLSRITRGIQTPPYALLELCVAKMGVNATWLLTGHGEPFGNSAEHLLPIATELLPGPPSSNYSLFRGAHPVISGLYSPTRYVYVVSPDDAVVRDAAAAIHPHDLLIIDGDTSSIRDGALGTLVVAVSANEPGGVAYLARIVGLSAESNAPMLRAAGPSSVATAGAFNRNPRNVRIRTDGKDATKKRPSAGPPTAGKGVAVEWDSIVGRCVQLTRPMSPDGAERS